MTLNGEHHRPFARSPKGHTKTFMLLHGCKRQLLDRLVRAKLATASTYRVARGRQIEITRQTHGGGTRDTQQSDTPRRPAVHPR